MRQLVAQLPWGHAAALPGRLGEQAERDWYAAAAAGRGWSRNALPNQIKSRLRGRAPAAPSNFPAHLAGPGSEPARQPAKDPYASGFLGPAGAAAERGPGQGLTGRARDTLLELGRGFAFAGRQARFDVDGDAFRIDLPLSRIPRPRYAAAGPKIGRPGPEHAGRPGFHAAPADDGPRDPDRHSPTVGILLRAGRDGRVVRYAPRGTSAPMAIADHACDSLPAHERSALPAAAGLAALLDAPGRRRSLPPPGHKLPARGFGGYSAHSLRAGFVTYAHLRGASDRAIAHQTRHRSLASIGTYVRVENA